MRVGLVQFAPVWEDRARTREKLSGLLRDLPSGTTDWLIFPEMTLSGFSMNLAATQLDDVDRAFFRKLAVERRVTVTYGGAQNGRNVAVTLDPEGRTISEYEKVHLFAHADENKHYTAGASYRDFTVQGLAVGPAVCYDLRFAETFQRPTTCPDVYIVIANWPTSRMDHWTSLLKARAIELQAYVIGVNRVGSDPFVEYPGRSMVFDPWGDLVADAGDREGIHVCDLDLSRIEWTRAKFPFLHDALHPDKIHAA